MESTLLDATEEEAGVGIPMSKEQFLNWNPDDGFLYEFENGLAIPTDGMRKEERYLVRNVQRAFAKTNASQDGGYMVEENDV